MAVRLKKGHREALSGIVFTLPFTIGFILLFLRPFVQAIVFSFSRLNIGAGGYTLEFVGLGNYKNALFVQPEFVRTWVETTGMMIVNVPLILAFSFFSAILLNQPFKGRTVARVIYFLPVILASGIVLQLEQDNYFIESLQDLEETVSGFMSLETLGVFLMKLKLPARMLEFIMAAVQQAPVIIRNSGVQILVFLAGLQSIPPSLYEAAQVEGGTSWENFWNITFPMLSPLILTNIVYTIVDSLANPQNELVKLIRSSAFGPPGYGVSTAMAVLYFLGTFAVLLITIGIVSRWVFYHE
ncbi:MAG: sugar ABC transporter permease [Bacillota bacterium]|jgi:ABC-type sugar transport system permease subunit|nr:sugar ABC transporter permease [Bacillota bacterium]